MLHNSISNLFKTTLKALKTQQKISHFCERFVTFKILVLEKKAKLLQVFLRQGHIFYNAFLRL